MGAAEMTGWTDVLMAVLAGFVFFAGLLFIAYLAWKSSERMESQPKYRRAVLLGLATIYLFEGLHGIYSVSRGEHSVLWLVFLLIPAFSAWTYLRAASQIKASPK